MNRVIIKPCGRDKFELVDDYICELGGDIIGIEKGFISNGADIPRIFWSLFPPNSPEYLSAVILHDYLTDEAERGNNPYKYADTMFLLALKDLGVNKIKAYIFYYSCRLYHKLKGVK